MRNYFSQTEISIENIKLNLIKLLLTYSENEIEPRRKATDPFYHWRATIHEENHLRVTWFVFGMLVSADAPHPIVRSRVD